MAAVIQRQMNVSGRSRGAAVNSPDGQTGEAAAELWERLRGLSAVIFLRARGWMRVRLKMCLMEMRSSAAPTLSL